VAPNLCRVHFYVGPSNTVLLAVVMHFLYHYYHGASPMLL